MKRARPGEPDAAGRAAVARAGDDAVRAAHHLLRRPAREREQQDPLRRDPVDDQMRDPVREGVGLAGAGAGDDEQRARAPSAARGFTVLHRGSLGGVEMGEIRHAGIMA